MEEVAGEELQALQDMLEVLLDRIAPEVAVLEGLLDLLGQVGMV